MPSVPKKLPPAAAPRVAPAVVKAAAAPVTARVAEKAGAWVDGASAPANAEGAPLATSAAPGALWGSGDAASLKTAMLTQDQAQLAQTLADAKKNEPTTYRAALRDALDVYLHNDSNLQRHLTMLDINGDGQLSLKEGYAALRQLGFSPAKAVIIAGGAELALLFSTRKTPGLSVPISNADAGQHKTSHTGGMDPEIALNKTLDDIMAHDFNKDGSVDMSEVTKMLDERAAKSPANVIVKTLIEAANKGEWAALFSLTGGKLSRDDLHDFFSGSLFFSLLPPDALAQRLVTLREHAPAA
jgi:Ca2+-binding EF-hand superfamily protein